MSFRKFIGKIHLYLGLTTGLIVFIVSITGSIYVFRNEIFHAVHKNILYVPEQGEQTLPITDLWENARKSLGNEGSIYRAVAYNNPERTWTFYTYESRPDAITYFGSVKRYKSVYINPYTGTVQGILNNKYEFFNLVKWLHWSLFLSTDYGQPIVGWSTFIFVCMLITGIILWWPKNKTARKQRFSIKWKARWRRLNYDLHNVLGFYVAVVLMVVSFTGMVWALSWFKSTVYTIAAGTTQPPQIENAKSTLISGSDSISALNQAYTDVINAYPHAYRYRFSLPHDRAGVIHADVQELEGLYYKNANFQYDQYTGKRLAVWHHDDKNTGEKLIAANYDIHVGAILGLPGKILAFIASLVSASLPLTGFMVWWGRRKKKRNTRFKNRRNHQLDNKSKSGYSISNGSSQKMNKWQEEVASEV